MADWKNQLLGSDGALAFITATPRRKDATFAGSRENDASDCRVGWLCASTACHGSNIPAPRAAAPPTKPLRVDVIWPPATAELCDLTPPIHNFAGFPTRP
jgi:hypothetical protein